MLLLLPGYAAFLLLGAFAFSHLQYQVVEREVTSEHPRWGRIKGEPRALRASIMPIRYSSSDHHHHHIGVLISTIIHHSRSIHHHHNSSDHHHHSNSDTVSD